jgi:hypothetical protein
MAVNAVGPPKKSGTAITTEIQILVAATNFTSSTAVRSIDFVRRLANVLLRIVEMNRE